ncbi:alkaline phosphatase family protein [Inhella gelatinilytica]|uniref:Alkaline phosphatase family protein n=1 Tax=Inhella gelatinilytica TaxID=2795030 RepID=A0A931IX03_9BURK|nr:alkaline phosphatase family protein [Inhella gelatinilytica]MBH9553704.1 alkaline phosphatase family protein [Inhella gelatinilytica]
MSLRPFALAASALLAPALQAAEVPRLVVMMVIDGLPERQIAAFAPQFGADGFRRFLDRGVWYRNARYGHGHTVTAAGHATLATGTHPARHGIVSNEWLDRDTGASVYCTEDRAHRYHEGPTQPDEGTSPKNLLVPTVGDILKAQSPSSKVIAVSGKDRGAILPAGHKGTAYMYRTETGRFSSSTYYMAQHPAWVNAFNGKFNADRFWKTPWHLARPAADYAQDSPDGQPWQGKAGFGNRLPATLGDGVEAPGERFYTDVLTSPYGDQMTLEFALAAVQHEALGQRGVPDVLAVSLSAHDYINHVFGPESRFSHDHLLHLDRQLQSFFASLDRQVGPGRYVVALSSDHGFLDTPEYRKQKGLNGGRVPIGAAITALNTHLQEQFKVPKLVRGFSAGALLFNLDLLRSQGLDAATVEAAAARYVAQLEGVQTSFGLAALSSDTPGPEVLTALRNSWYAPRSGQLAIVPQEGWMYAFRPTGTSHGSPWDYDRHVPILLWGPAWWGTGVVDTPVQTVDFAPTLAQVLQLPPLTQAQGQVLPRPDGKKRRPPQPRTAATH